MALRIARFSRDGDVAFGVVEGGRGNGLADLAQDELVVAEISGHPFGGGVVRFTGARFQLADVRLLAPVLPSKVVAVERTYAADDQEAGSAPPTPKSRQQSLRSMTARRSSGRARCSSDSAQIRRSKLRRRRRQPRSPDHQTARSARFRLTPPLFLSFA